MGRGESIFYFHIFLPLLEQFNEKIIVQSKNKLIRKAHYPYTSDRR
jgi:hypothetical protein